MGVTGLWRLIEPAGKPVPVETLENKVLAVDISIWLHQMVKGYQDAKGAPLPNAHLMGLFQRLCKLLYFKVKPVFVFDGGFPDLKKETIVRRQDNKAKYNSDSERIKRELLLLLSKKSAISSLLGKKISPKKNNTNQTVNDDIFKLPALPQTKEETESESDDDSSSSSIVDVHSVDLESNTFKSMPLKEKYDLLLELKDTRKMNSWGKLNELPKKGDNFSDFQMQRLLKRRKIQECLQETEKEMGEGGMSFNELESLLNEEGIDTKIDVLPTRRIASNENTRFLLINNVKQALLDAKKKEELRKMAVTSNVIEVKDQKVVKSPNTDDDEDDLKKAIEMSLECEDDQNQMPGTSKQTSDNYRKRDELQEDLEKAIKMSLECENPDTSKCTSKTDDSWTSALSDSDNDYTDSEDKDGFEQINMSSAKAYIMQYTDFTSNAINKIISNKPVSKQNETKKPNLEEILAEINREKSVILEKIELSSDEEHRKSFVDARYTNVSTESPIQIEDGKSEHDPDIEPTQTSVLYIENPTPDVVTLDTSEEDAESQTGSLKKEMSCYKDEVGITGLNNVTTEQLESEASDSDFEEVPEIDNRPAKPYVQVTLDMNKKSVDDDIFADCFEIDKYKNSNVNIETETEDITMDIKIETKKKDLLIERQTNSNNMEASVTLKESVQKETKFDNDISVNTVTTGDILHASQNKQSNIEISEESFTEYNSSKNETYKTVQEKNLVNKLNADMNPISVKEVISTEKLNEMARVVEEEEQNLVQEKGRLDRIGRNITEQMTKEAQELLQLFGIPYVIAPMEAEAQCAFLEEIKLTDGTITDDSDIWLFGGKTVYKNFFNQKKHVMQFLSDRIERSFNLSREQLILLALLVGSDYTTGVDGVGPVTAMEILASFPFNKKQLMNETSKQGRYQHIVTGMQDFKKWLRAGRRTDNTTLKNKLKNVTINDDFPSIRVVQAYLEPNVEKSKDKFTWGEIDITLLRDYTKTKFGWSQSKLDEIIKPVLKRLAERKSQKTVHDYFKRKVELQSLEEHMSKRVKAAVQKLGPEQSLIEQVLDECGEQNPLEQNIKMPRKRKNRIAAGNRSLKSKTKCTAPGTSARDAESTDNEIDRLNVRVVPHVDSSSSGIDIKIPKTDRFQEIIPQREKEKQSLLQNKMKAIEIFRKTKIDRKRKATKRKVILPKDKADLSENSDSD